jgi:hypothetical protein
MCSKPATDASGQWYIIKEHSLYFPLGWVPWAWFQDIGMFSIIRAHIICRSHGATGYNTIRVIDGN